MTQIAQLSEAEIEERFHVTGTRPVAFLLAGFARDGVGFSVHLAGGQDSFQTMLLAAKADKNQLIFDCSGSDETNRAVLKSAGCIFVGRPAGIHVQFSTGPVSEVAFQGSRAFATRLPVHVVRLQRREAFRVETPRGKPLQFFARLADDSLLKLPVRDISIGGLGLIAVAPLPESVIAGTVLANCRFALPDDASDVFVAVTVCHIVEFESRTGARQWHVGVRFDTLSPADEGRIQRYIARVERDRHELS